MSSDGLYMMGTVILLVGKMVMGDLRLMIGKDSQLMVMMVYTWVDEFMDGLIIGILYMV